MAPTARETSNTPVKMDACAKDADKLEMLLQAVEYRSVGVQHVDRWIASARKDLHTATARRGAEAALRMSPLSWHDR